MYPYYLWMMILVGSVIPVWAIIGEIRYHLANRNEPAKRSLTPAERSEIYRDMDWWDREFRRLSGEPEPVSTNWGRELETRITAAYLDGNAAIFDPKPPTTAEIQPPYAPCPKCGRPTRIVYAVNRCPCGGFAAMHRPNDDWKREVAR